MILPYEENLEIKYLNHIFDRTSNCYKFFWFLAILEKIDIKTEYTYDELITEMIVIAWYMVNEYGLKLGPNNTTDNLEEVVKYLYKVSFDKKVYSAVKKEVLRKKLNELNDEKYIDFKETLINNVPYCLQSPFYKEIKDPDKNKIDIINRKERLIYYFKEFKKLNTVIFISDEWVDYLRKNKIILIDWARYGLVNYLEKKNRLVPGISEKILPPYSRDLKRVKEYWGTIIKVAPDIKEIYGDNLLKDVSISIDHFVPWQFVAHDELWNLCPTTKSINSSKSNNLPNWDKYFIKLCNLEYRAYQLRYENELVAKEFEKCSKYHINDSKVKAQLYSDNIDKDIFRERLANVIKPEYDFAKKSGFQEW
ncbi:MAG: hypothetical protein J5625_04130 [Lachnospiraceae bacterium]|nr:hypothetical protein [Lachnospiraceae bacterium]